MDTISWDTHLGDIFRLTPQNKKGLARLSIETVGDLLYHFPTRYGDIAKFRSISELTQGDLVSVHGKISGLNTRKTFRGKVPMAEATVQDHTGSIKVTWFHQPYIIKTMNEGDLVQITGKVSKSKAGALYITNPELERTKNLPIDSMESLFGEAGEQFGTPVYPESKGITSRWIHHHIHRIFKTGILESVHDPLPEDMLESYHLPTLATGLVWVHAPRSRKDAESARKRFAFEEIFYIQVSRLSERRKMENLSAYSIQNAAEKINEFIATLPFTPTKSQSKAIETISKDISVASPMARLLEGDVGSGKTAVAAAVMYAAALSHPPQLTKERLQCAYMAPTEILAKQQFESLIQLYRHTDITIALITSSGCLKYPSKVDPNKPTPVSRAQLLKWVKSGEMSVIVGTHSLIQKSVLFKHLALAIVDEQHRFGTKQRMQLARKDAFAPHFLSMTATPIPRTLALTIYGDLDLTILDEMPKGRKPIISDIIPPTKRDETYTAIRQEMEKGRQVYVVCPRINEPDPEKENALNVKSVKAEAKRLDKDVFPDKVIDILHSKMKPAEKDEIMSTFARGEIDILVATSVVEVGVNVPNATVILIEGADRFGLSQLHQLRGRVVRSNHQAYCYVFTDSGSKNTMNRLKALISAKNGFELAEMDLALRGAGDLAGRKQWGITDLGMEAVKNIKMVEAARTEAGQLLDHDPTLSHAPAIKAHIESEKRMIHFE